MIKSLCLRGSEQVSLTVSHPSEEGIRVTNALQVLWRRLNEVRLAANEPQRFLKAKHNKTFATTVSCGFVNLCEVGPQGADGGPCSTTDHLQIEMEKFIPLESWGRCTAPGGATREGAGRVRRAQGTHLC